MRFLHSSISGLSIVHLQHLPHLCLNNATTPMRHTVMAYASNETTGILNGVNARIDALMIEIRARLARRKVFRQTLHELSVLSDRELADLGLHRTEIHRIAYQAAYEL